MFRVGKGNFQSKLPIVSPPQLRVAVAYHGSHFYACLIQLRDFESLLWFDKDIIPDGFIVDKMEKSKALNTFIFLKILDIFSHYNQDQIKTVPNLVP